MAPFFHSEFFYLCFSSLACPCLFALEALPLSFSNPVLPPSSWHYRVVSGRISRRYNPSLFNWETLYQAGRTAVALPDNPGRMGRSSSEGFHAPKNIRENHSCLSFHGGRRNKAGWLFPQLAFRGSGKYLLGVAHPYHLRLRPALCSDGTVEPFENPEEVHKLVKKHTGIK